MAFKKIVVTLLSRFKHKELILKNKEFCDHLSTYPPSPLVQDQKNYVFFRVFNSFAWLSKKLGCRVWSSI